MQKHSKRDKKHDKGIPSNEKKQLEDRILELEKERESLTLKNDEYETKISEQECIIDQQFKEIDRLRDTEFKQGSLNELEKTISEKQMEIARLKEAAKAFAQEEQKLKRDISEKDKHIENLNYTQKKNKEKYEESLQRLTDENKRYIEKLRSCQSDIEMRSTMLAEKGAL